MKLVQFVLHDKKIRIGVLQGDKVIDVNSSYNFIPNSLVEFFQASHALNTIEGIIKNPKDTYSLDEIKLISPVTNPDKVLCVGLNYGSHCDELHEEYPKFPVVFSKFSSAICGPYDSIVLPPTNISKFVDWEIELAVVIGTIAKDVTVADALKHVLGFTVAQDITARDWQEKNGGQLLLSKTMNTFCPLGPYIVTKDEIENPYDLQLKTWVNGKIKQDGNTKEIIHKFEELISYLSSVMTLHPGDIILTGTPCGIGLCKNPKESLQPGDILESEISQIGKLVNHVH